MINQEFWDRLSRYEGENVFNPWRMIDPNDAGETPISDRIRRLDAHLDCNAKYLLIGEAPGYRGCHFSGVPFTSEWQYFDSRIAGPFAGKRITKFDAPLKETSASVIYRVMDECGVTDKTIMWNSFPWHPHNPGVPMSNRTPKPREVMVGAKLLGYILEANPGIRVIAVGRIAEGLLAGLGVRSASVRHPSMGGSNIFRQQFIDLTKEG